MTDIPDQQPTRVSPALVPNGRATRRFGSFRAVTALMIREMSTQYGRTPGGFIWTVLQPLGAITVLALGFSVLLRRPSLGTSFIQFYASAYVFFTLYTTLARTVADSLRFSAPLLKYPAVTWVDAVLARFLLNVMMQVATSVILLLGIFTLFGSPGRIDFIPIFEATALAALLGLGVGVFNGAVKGIFPLYAIIWDVLTRPLMIASGVFYLLEDLPRVAQQILWYNPLIHITALARSGFYVIYTPHWLSELYVVAFSLTPLFFGILLMRRYHRDILNW